MKISIAVNRHLLSQFLIIEFALLKPSNSFGCCFALNMPDCLLTLMLKSGAHCDIGVLTKKTRMLFKRTSAFLEGVTLFVVEQTRVL